MLSQKSAWVYYTLESCFQNYFILLEWKKYMLGNEHDTFSAYALFCLCMLQEICIGVKNTCFILFCNFGLEHFNSNI